MRFIKEILSSVSHLASSTLHRVCRSLRVPLVLAGLTSLFFFSSVAVRAAPTVPVKDIKKMIFEEQRIEGKIRRPQLVLIKAEQRPTFEPMVMESLGKSTNIVKAVDQAALERSPYEGAFQFEGTAVSNLAP